MERLKKIEAMCGLRLEYGPKIISRIEYDQNGMYLYEGKKYKSIEELENVNNAILKDAIFLPTRLPIESWTDKF